MFKFEQLRVYTRSLDFVDAIYTATRNWPKDETFGLSSQLQRAAVSILLNIAEGASRTSKDFRHFLSLSRGSCYECVAILDIALRRKYITKDRYDYLYAECVTIAKMLSALRTSLVASK